MPQMNETMWPSAFPTHVHGGSPSRSLGKLIGCSSPGAERNGSNLEVLLKAGSCYAEGSKGLSLKSWTTGIEKQGT